MVLTTFLGNVAELYPDLVRYDEKGKPYAMRYRSLVLMLLNELQRQRVGLEGQEELISDLSRKFAELDRHRE